MIANQIEKLELRTMRMFALVAASAVAVTGAVTSSVNDPKWERGVVILIAITPLALSYVSGFVRRNYHYFLYPMYVSIFTWEAHLAYLNNFNVEEAMSMILILVLAGLVPYRKYWHFGAHLIYVVLLDLYVIFKLTNLGMDRITFGTYILVGGVIAYLLSGSRVRIMNSLLESWERLRSISDSAYDAIVAVDNEKKIRFWNLSAFKIFGYSEAEIIGESVSKILPYGWSGNKGRVRARRRDGSELPVDITLGEWGNGSSKTKTLVMRDATEKEKNEDELIKRNEELGKLNTIMVGRELKMRELKQQIQRLSGSNK